VRQACFKVTVHSQSDGFLGPLWTSTSFGDFRYEDTARRMRRSRCQREDEEHVVWYLVHSRVVRLILAVVARGERSNRAYSVPCLLVTVRPYTYAMTSRTPLMRAASSSAVQGRALSSFAPSSPLTLVEGVFFFGEPCAVAGLVSGVVERSRLGPVIVDSVRMCRRRLFRYEW
jgi:hypothetical protein